jgi:hypothetical protein
MAITKVLKKSGSNYGWQPIANLSPNDTYLTKIGASNYAWQSGDTARNILAGDGTNYGFANVSFAPDSQSVGWLDIEIEPTYAGTVTVTTTSTKLNIDWGDGASTVETTAATSRTHAYTASSGKVCKIRSNQADSTIGWLRSEYAGMFGYSAIMTTSAIYKVSGLLTFKMFGSSATSCNLFASGLFNGATKLVSFDGLSCAAIPSGVTFADNYMVQMFYNCTSLTSNNFTVPALPSTVKEANNYLASMFYRCTGFVTVSKAITALPTGVTSASSYLYSMFEYCSNLTTASFTIPALPTSIADTNGASLYLMYMFDDTALTAAKIPNVPAVSATGITALPTFTTLYYSPVAPTQPITTLALLRSGYKYHN